MGQLQQIVLQLVVVLLVITAAFTWYGAAVLNGGYPLSSVPLNESVAKYYNQTYAFNSQFLNSTTSATQAPATTDPVTGSSSLLVAGAQTLTLVMGSIGQMVDIVTQSSSTLGMFGVPSYFFSYAIMFISVLMGLLIFAAIYKWWV